MNNIVGLIIAIENYSEAQQFARTLPGTLVAADKFHRWLRNGLGTPAESIIVCSSPSHWKKWEGQAVMLEANRDGITMAVDALLRRGAQLGGIDRLFVYAAGHGLQVTRDGWRKPEDLLLLANFRSATLDGDRVVFVDELQGRLANGLGPGVHYFFVDACRTEAPERFNPQHLSVMTPASTPHRASSHRLASARSGTAAATSSVFIDALLSYLNTHVAAAGASGPQRPPTLSAAAFSVADSVRRHQGKIDLQLDGLDDRILPAGDQEPPGPTSYPIAEGTLASIPTISGPVPTIGIDTRQVKIPPVELLVRYDRIIFLGETNSQLPTFIEDAAKMGKRWRRIDVFGLEDFAEHGRQNMTAEGLVEERDRAEAALERLLRDYCQEFAIYRYEYQGAYGSLWLHDETGVRRVHISPRLAWVDTRRSPASDIVELPHSPNLSVQHMFELAETLIRTTTPRASSGGPEREPPTRTEP